MNSRIVSIEWQQERTACGASGGQVRPPAPFSDSPLDSDSIRFRNHLSQDSPAATNPNASFLALAFSKESLSRVSQLDTGNFGMNEATLRLSLLIFYYSAHNFCERWDIIRHSRKHVAIESVASPHTAGSAPCNARVSISSAEDLQGEPCSHAFPAFRDSSSKQAIATAGLSKLDFVLSYDERNRNLT